MLIPCPECERLISDRAVACPGCGFPYAAHRVALDAVSDTERDRSSRVHAGEVDCVRCDARGFRLIPEGEPQAGGFEWCAICEERGRVPRCQSARGYFAVAKSALAAFLAGQRDPGDLEVVFLGTAEPAAHRYPPPPDDE